MSRLWFYVMAIAAAIATFMGLKVRGDRYREKARNYRDIADTNAKAAKIREEQLRDAANRPMSKAELVARMQRNRDRL